MKNDDSYYDFWYTPNYYEYQERTLDKSPSVEKFNDGTIVGDNSKHDVGNKRYLHGDHSKHDGSDCETK